MHDLEVYFTGLLFVCSILLLWFFGTLKELVNYSEDELLAQGYFYTAKLFGCYICSSFWLSGLVGCIIALNQGYSFWYPFLTYSTYPPLAYIFKKIIEA